MQNPTYTNSDTFYLEQQTFRQLFSAKKLQEFVHQIDDARGKKLKVSPHALKLCEFYREILKKNDRAIQILNSSKDGWKINKIDDKAQMCVKASGTVLEIRYEGHLIADIEKLCIILYQLNLFHLWIPFCTKSEDLKEISSLQKVGVIEMKMPFIAERYTHVYGVGIDKIRQNGTIIIYAQGITLKKQLMEKFGIVVDKLKYEKKVTFDLKFFICQISYKSQKQFIFRSYCELDTQMSYVPGWVLKTVMNQMGGFIFDRIIKHSHNFKGSQFEKQMIRDKQNSFYPWISEKMAEWHTINKNKNKAPNQLSK